MINKLINKIRLLLFGNIKKYDKHKNLIYYRDTDGNEEWYHYNDNNRLTMIERENGLHECYDYDKDNNLIYYKDINDEEYYFNV